MISRTQKSRSVAIAIASGAVFLSVFGVGCSFTVDSGVLIEGDAGIECASDEKKCPIDREDPDGPKECVGNTLQQYGCARASCNPCALAGASARCNTAGDCAISQCDDDRMNCDGDVANGCEVEFERDPENCGGCGNINTGAFICDLANASNTCVNGNCIIGVCVSGWGNCDGSTSTGCETDITTTENCGDCENACEVGQACVDGECV